ncbi:hypothetical protein OEZ86_005992 [Tetradesmus obliquus]|uniref:Uncharacterized protein n=1 Tax=Tetradesmus obliquus TaxID=3088 RepID=A0ABY8TV56_TETOB|nr:hypothetical protein OEZ85_011729 [Tetradesmus obliquus]WIA32810.1 hypothetical protein OEZ86_005992 [Tetradesmus obliquus]
MAETAHLEPTRPTPTCWMLAYTAHLVQQSEVDLRKYMLAAGTSPEAMASADGTVMAAAANDIGVGGGLRRRRAVLLDDGHC